jgi:hypothetical protein
MTRRDLLALTVLIASAIWCGSTGGPSISESSCTDGEAYAPDASFPFSDLPADNDPTAPLCPRRCGSDAGGMISDLPAGFCSDNAFVCNTSAKRTCACPEEGSTPASGFTCRCRDNRWSCVLVAIAGGVCPNLCLAPNNDAGSSDAQSLDADQ